MPRTEDLRVVGMRPIVAPEDLKRVFPLNDQTAEFVADSRRAFLDVMHGRDPRLVAVVGPCSIHEATAALDYARRLAGLAAELKDQLLVVMRVYFEKPRTTVGWKG
ncbi:MAG TPA: 3-deoxy-7-phosphoheptulonate synthase, partial [Deferrisomatales bacterium]|nr:3-deoxy-7-phosphoheptulonate synthase [Deferrisomatales bacterium]